MKFRRGEDEQPELNLVPLIDVMLMTLIFLVVTTSFSKEAQLRIRLPEASAQTTQPQPSSLRVAINAKGQYFINDKQLLKGTPDALRNAMARAAGSEKDPLVIIHADAQTPHQFVIHVMDASRRLGFTRLTFATQQPSARSE
jgi:biopolymer transport protein ExbD